MSTKVVSKVYSYCKLDAQTRDFITNEINREFGGIPIVQNYSWTEPQWTVLLVNEDNDVVTFYNIIERICRFDEVPIKVVGINNLITPLKFRGLGYGSQIMETFGKLLFDELNAEYGLLLCADDLISFYDRFSWYNTESIVRFDQPDGKKIWQANVMLLTRQRTKLYPQEIDLCGLPW